MRLLCVGAPLIRSPSVQYGVENEPVRLQCMVEAIPPPTKITWYKLKPHQQVSEINCAQPYPPINLLTAKCSHCAYMPLRIVHRGVEKLG